MADALADALDRLAATPKRLAHLVAEASDAVLDAAPPGEWSARTVLAHFRDCEVLADGMRLARMLAEEAPVFADFDEAAWAANRNRSRDHKAQLLGDFALHRQATLLIFAGLRPEDWERTGSHPMRGAFTVRTWVDQWLEHDLGHLDQLERLLGETVDEVLKRRFHPRG
ncbi:MAG: DinB family protein [Chloroflexi bacterium]|nr:DinB family protein [Chloroflexota bacterium]